MTKQTKPTDGGPAFPDDRWQNGMSLRDWFAGMALQGRMMMRDGSKSSVSWGEYCGMEACSCYDLADAMLAERSK